MTKREKYDAMKKDGAKLRAFNTLRAEEVDALYKERFGDEVEAKPDKQPDEPERIPPLYFDHGGWCNELGVSFFAGFYRPATLREYECLLPHSSTPGI